MAISSQPIPRLSSRNTYRGWQLDPYRKAAAQWKAKTIKTTEFFHKPCHRANIGDVITSNFVASHRIMLF